MKLCIVSPHIDDALLSCGIRMQRHIALGHEVVVLDIFSAGTNSENRKAEEREAQSRLGAKPFFLDELDAPDRDQKYESLLNLFHSTPGQSDYIDHVKNRIAAFFVEQDVTMAFFPLAAGTHIDHQIAYEAGRRLDHKHTRFYEDRPYIIWPGILKSRMNQIGSNAKVADASLETMQQAVSSYHYLGHFMPEGKYRDEALPLYLAGLDRAAPVKLKAREEVMVATEAELKKLYDALAAYESQMPFIYDSYDTFIRDSLAYQKFENNGNAYAERMWTLEG